MTIYSIGHSDWPIQRFLAILRSFAIDVLVDIRRYPRSRSNLQFDGARLAAALVDVGIEYVSLPALGGRRGRKDAPETRLQEGWRVDAFRAYAGYATTKAFHTALDALVARARRARCVIMCAEALWWRCHRRIVADYLLVEGPRVRHILDVGKAQEALLTPFARLEPDGTLAYPAS